MARPTSSFGSEVCLGENVGCGGVGLEETDAIALIEEEVEVSGRIGLDGVETGLVRRRCGGR